MKISIIIRTFNEEKHLAELLNGIKSQSLEKSDIETVIVDSGSVDRTLEIAEKYECKIVHISKDEFTFGRSLNIGCAAAKGEYLVFISGHCIPENSDWLEELVTPLVNGEASYSYGRQIGNDDSKYSENQLFLKYFPENSKIPQEGFFCNNANAALSQDVWRENRFNEEVTGLEDMELAKRLTDRRMSIAYVATATVYHIHEESWSNVKTRYEREAIALQYILPAVHVGFTDFIRYVISAVLLDIGAALQERKLGRVLPEIVMFRLMQFWGSYRGNHEHRKLSKAMKEKYFYPR